MTIQVDLKDQYKALNRTPEITKVVKDALQKAFQSMKTGETEKIISGSLMLDETPIGEFMMVPNQGYEEYSELPFVELAATHEDLKIPPRDRILLCRDKDDFIDYFKKLGEPTKNALSAVIPVWDQDSFERAKKEIVKTHDANILYPRVDHLENVYVTEHFIFNPFKKPLMKGVYEHWMASTETFTRKRFLVLYNDEKEAGIWLRDKKIAQEGQKIPAEFLLVKSPEELFSFRLYGTEYAEIERVSQLPDFDSNPNKLEVLRALKYAMSDDLNVKDEWKDAFNDVTPADLSNVDSLNTEDAVKAFHKLNKALSRSPDAIDSLLYGNWFGGKGGAGGVNAGGTPGGGGGGSGGSVGYAMPLNPTTKPPVSVVMQGHLAKQKLLAKQDVNKGLTDAVEDSDNSAGWKDS